MEDRKHISNRLIGTPADFKWFHLEKGSVPSIYTKPKDSLDIDYPRNKGRLANLFFSEKRSSDVSLGLPPLPRNVSIQNRFLLGLGRPIRDMLLIFQDDRSTTLSMRMGLF